MVTVNWPRTEFDANRRDVEGSVARAFGLVPEFAERVRAATRETRIVGTGDLPNFFRKPYGPGWALVGDAGYHKDPITAQGISDAFRDAEELAAGLDDALSGRRGFDDAMAEHQQARDARLLGAVQTSQEAMDGFVSVIAGTVPVPEFFGHENTERILAGAATGAPS
jgi:2-polyprenyl-6-methoxyphenol hydroxylase-like FAD-dependent oxidoreductase